MRKAGVGPNSYYILDAARHVESLLSLQREEWESLGPALSQGLQWVEQGSPQKIYIACLSEKVPHVHFHLVPRSADHEKGISHLDKALSGSYPGEGDFH